MNAFRMYLWKELREQRAAVVALAIVLPALVLTVSASMPKRILGDATFTASVILLALVATLVAIGGELLISERRAETVWLERLPGGLALAFPAKLLVFGLSTVVALASGFGLGLAATFLEGRDVLAKACTSILEEGALGGIFAAGLVLAGWTFAASAWAPRGMVALCAGGVSAAGLGWPVVMTLARGYRPEPWEVPAVLVALVGGALVSAWTGYVYGRPNGPLPRALRAIGAGTLCVLPLWGWGLHQLRERDRFVLAEAEVSDAWVFQDGRKMLLEASRSNRRWGNSMHVVLADLERGTWQRIGGRDTWYEALWSGGHEPMSEPAVVRIVGNAQHIALDARDAARLPDWIDDGRQPPTFVAAGHGWSCLEEGRASTVYVDPYHDLSVTSEELGIATYEVCILPDLWLIDAFGREWFEYLPDSGPQPAEWLQDVYELGPALPDGRVLATMLNGEVVLLDVAERRVEVIAGSEQLDAEYHPLYGPALRPFRPGEPLLFETWSEERFQLDLECLELRPLDDSHAGLLLRALPDGTLVFRTDDGIFRRDPVTGARTLVFSFADAREEEALEP